MSYKHKRSSVAGKAPTSGDFEDGEIIVNTADGRAFVQAGGAVKTLINNDDLASAVSGKLDKTGGTMTGRLALNDAPADPMHAANKQYVDTGLANKVSNSRLTISTAAPSGGVDGDIWFKV